MEEEWCRWSAEAARWAEGNGWGFSVAGTEESARNIFLSAPCGSFFVTVPEHVGTEEWVSLSCVMHVSIGGNDNGR